MFSRLLPARTRRRYLKALAESIEFANYVAPSKWGVTLFTDGLTLNVGMINVLTLTRFAAGLVVDRKRRPKRRYRLLNNGLPYKSVPRSLGLEIPLSGFRAAYQKLANSHIALIREAAVTRRHPMTVRCHSPGICSYLLNELDVPFFQPAYYWIWQSPAAPVVPYSHPRGYA
jgi:hypothetical protein